MNTRCDVAGSCPARRAPTIVSERPADDRAGVGSVVESQNWTPKLTPAQGKKAAAVDTVFGRASNGVAAIR